MYLLFGTFFVCNHYYPIKNSIIVSIIIVIVRFLIEALCIVGFEWIFEVVIFAKYDSLFSIPKILCAFSSKYIQYFIFLVIYQKKHYLDDKNIRYFKNTSFILSAMYILCIFFNVKSLFFIPGIGKIMIFTLVIYNVVLIIFDRYQVKHTKIEREYAEKRKEFALINLKNEMQEKYNKEIQEEQNNTRNIKHNIDNQLCSIYAYIENGENEAAMRYIENIRKDLLTGQHTNYTGHIGADAILHEKLTKARELGIEISEYYGLIDFGDVEPKDLTIVLACALDNALEAIEKIEKGKERKLSVSIYNNGPYVTIGVGNSVEDGLNIDFDHSSKENSDKSHGYGVKDIKEIGVKYDGSAHYEVDETFVLLNVILYTHR